MSLHLNTPFVEYPLPICVLGNPRQSLMAYGAVHVLLLADMQVKTFSEQIHALVINDRPANPGERRLSPTRATASGATLAS
jgi:hypothetical protein